MCKVSDFHQETSQLLVCNSPQRPVKLLAFKSIKQTCDTSTVPAHRMTKTHTHTHARKKGNRREPALGLHFRALTVFFFLMHLPCIPYIYPPPVLFQTRLSGSEGTANKRLREMFIAVSITDLKLYFFLGETMKHEKRRQKGRDNRHSRHIKTQPGRRSTASGAARRTQIAEQSSPMCCGTAQ